MPGGVAGEASTARALAERRPRDAIIEYQLSDSLPDGPVTTYQLNSVVSIARAFDSAGERDSAIVMFEKYLSNPDDDRMSLDGVFLAGTYKRLGELYEAKNDRQRAASNSTKFISLWYRADPELQPSVQDARRRFARLSDVERR